MKKRSEYGTAHPPGAALCNGGANFSLYAKNAAGVELLLFDQAGDPAPCRVVAFDPALNRSYHYWHVFVQGVKAGQLYAYRVHGPDDPECGLRFDSNKILLDPYGRAIVTPPGYDRAADGDMSRAMKNAVADTAAYDWEGDEAPRTPSSRTIIYEMHVRGFTRHPSSGVGEETRGTYAGLIEKIPYLQDLGITAVELLPVFHFDPLDATPGHVNYWGYSPLSFFAPHAPYSSRQDALGPLDEFRDMVKALHRAGIEVILDVVFNHTAEGNENGPTLCYRGIANDTYYILENDRRHYSNYSGCGNTLNANHPVVRRMILDSLRYWVGEMHVDGFRFDLASILARDNDGRVLPNPPVLWDIETDPMLAGTKLIAEAWDAAGLYQVGSFVGDAWKEWNGRFRDDARDFFRGEPGALRRFADRIVGSPGIFGHEGREPEQSINFVTCHDGFTLNDLVSYNSKHNEANGENNRDGTDDNKSWNCGVEGPSNDPAIEELRNRQVKNFLAATMLSIGVPMFLMGDECRQTRRGNNNPWCQDNDISWLDWSLLEPHADVHRFFRLLSHRRGLRTIRHEQLRLSLNEILRSANISWHGTRPNEPDWSDTSRAFAFTAELRADGLFFHGIFNASWQALDFTLPAGPAPWRRWIDTALPSPQDIVPWQEADAIADDSYHLAARSVVCLYARSRHTMALDGDRHMNTLSSCQ
jgi:glycogen operon protein